MLAIENEGAKVVFYHVKWQIKLLDKPHARPQRKGQGKVEYLRAKDGGGEQYTPNISLAPL